MNTYRNTGVIKKIMVLEIGRSFQKVAPHLPYNTRAVGQVPSHVIGK